MPNLVGIGLSQVPTNSMLGGLAYQDPEHASIKDLDLKNLSQINSEIGDTAVDVFVYDTSKDSDGGAWRKRTTHTSWYNETLGTATRGTRREFPAVAVIVVETGQVTIYDGDDPDLPMWMVFNGTAGGASHNLLVSTGSYCLSALNGTVFMGALAIYVNFISEYSRGHRSSGGSSYWNGPYKGNIAERNAGKGSTQLGDKLILGGSADVAMTVLPSAPIDDATGLPVPTIAVATSAGISVITDSGSVYDLTTGDVYDHYSKVEFGANNRVYYTPYDTQVLYSRAIPSADQNYTAYNTQNTNRVMFPTMDHGGFTSGHPVRLLGTNGGTNPLLIVKNKASGSNETSYAPSGFGIRPGLTFIDEGETNPTSMVAYATTSYNTGYQQGDIKGAFLSDTDTTNATYTTVADDWATASAWTKQNSISLSSSGSGTSGTVSITGNGTGSNVYFFNPITVEANTNYVVTITFGAYHANDFFINTTQYSTSNQVLDIHGLSGLTRGGHFNSGSNTTLYIQGYQVSTTATTITNVVVQKVSERDRSSNNKGLTVYGTVTKSAVATGADLVAYSGWSDSNFLRQPYNAGLNYGTGDFSVMGWIKMPDVSQLGFILDRASLTTSGGGPRFAIYAESSQLKFYTFNGSSNTEESTSLTGYNNQWICFVCNRLSNGNMEIYLNGDLKDNMTGTSRDVSNTASPVTTIGHRYNAAAGATSANIFEGSIALLRTSATVPTAKQVKKMYNDEKHLFQENAKATLYGSSDAVTALGYDEDTELLHVGTSSGRSDFQGLRRINNTTTAVTTAISAHDGFIVEQ